MNEIVSGYLDFVERQAERETVMTISDWVEHVDRILSATGETLLLDKGKITRKQMEYKVTDEYKNTMKKHCPK